MLDVKGIAYQLDTTVPGVGYVKLRRAGFKGRTIPALKLDGRCIQGSREISRALEALQPDPPLFPADPELSARVEEAERWGEQEFQPVPRRIARYGFARNPRLRRALVRRRAKRSAMVAVLLSGPFARYYGRVVEPDGLRPDEAGVRHDLAALPEMLDRVDGLLADETLALDPPNAATIQILATVRTLGAFADLRGYLAGRPAAAAAAELFPRDPGLIPAYLPVGWLACR
jgi:glutathione S-transferase